MHFIVVKFQTRPEWTDRWMHVVAEFTSATKAEPGCLWFEWSRSIEDPAEFVLVEAFTEEGAAAHVASGHFDQAIPDMTQALARTPQIISRLIEGDSWDAMGEITIE